MTTASTNAIEITAPVFWTQHPGAGGDAAPVRGTVPIIAAVFGELNMPEPIPTMNM